MKYKAGDWVQLDNEFLKVISICDNIPGYKVRLLDGNKHRIIAVYILNTEGKIWKPVLGNIVSAIKHDNKYFDESEKVMIGYINYVDGELLYSANRVMSNVKLSETCRDFKLNELEPYIEKEKDMASYSGTIDAELNFAPYVDFQVGDKDITLLTNQTTTPIGGDERHPVESVDGIQSMTLAELKEALKNPPKNMIASDEHRVRMRIKELEEELKTKRRKESRWDKKLKKFVHPLEDDRIAAMMIKEDNIANDIKFDDFKGTCRTFSSAYEKIMDNFIKQHHKHIGNGQAGMIGGKLNDT